MTCKKKLSNETSCGKFVVYTRAHSGARDKTGAGKGGRQRGRHGVYVLGSRVRSRPGAAASDCGAGARRSPEAGSTAVELSAGERMEPSEPPGGRSAGGDFARGVPVAGGVRR